MQRASLITCGFFLLLTSCQTPSPSFEVASDYLKALKDGDIQAVSDITCLTNPQEREPVAPGVKSWSLIEEIPKISTNDPAGTYIEVLTEIEYTGIASPVKDLFVLTVWKTEDLYEYQLRGTERINQVSRDTERAIRASQEILGHSVETYSSSRTPLEPPSRDGLTSREYCVTQLRKPQGTSDMKP